MMILLIRHGETTGDVEDRYGGNYDDHLTEKGRSQLQNTAAQLRGRRADALFTSTLARARESAAIVNEVLRAPLTELNGLRERNYGILAGLTKAEALKRYPEAVEAHTNPANTDPEGESQADFTKRVLEAFQTIVEQEFSIVAIVSHGGPIKTILRHIGKPLPDRIGDGEVIEIELP
jgi:broad specificity phosphatase PhoE